MDGQTALHVRVAELEEALTELRSDVARVRVAPTGNPERIEHRATARIAGHKDRVAALDADIAQANRDLAETERLLSAARARADQTSHRRQFVVAATLAFAGVYLLVEMILRLFP